MDQGKSNEPTNDEDVVLERRIDKRLRRIEETDMPWTRRVVGGAIIALALFLGWRMMVNRAAHEIERVAEEKGHHRLPEATSATDPATNQTASLQAEVATGNSAEKAVAVDLAVVDQATLETISECTKGDDAFRLLKTRPNDFSEAQPATLENAFAPIFDAKAQKTKRQLSLQNVKIMTATGEEWRLHAATETQKGKLGLKLFRVAGDGLPEEIDFPADLQDLKGATLTDEAVARFLKHANPPGEALEVERHEAWSFQKGAGAQVISVNGAILDLQVYAKGKFLACNREMKNASVLCKCIDR